MATAMARWDTSRALHAIKDSAQEHKIDLGLIPVDTAEWGTRPSKRVKIVGLPAKNVRNKTLAAPVSAGGLTPKALAITLGGLVGRKYGAGALKNVPTRESIIAGIEWLAASKFADLAAHPRFAKATASLVREERAPKIERQRPEDVWQQGYDSLQTYVCKYGHTQVRRSYQTLTNYGLGRWVAEQRTKRARRRLSPERITRLETLDGWTWEKAAKTEKAAKVPSNPAWQNGYKLLQRYVALYGHAQVPSSYETPEGFPLGRWVAGQRRDYRTGYGPGGSLQPEFIRQLTAVEGWTWEPKSAHEVAKPVKAVSAKPIAPASAKGS